MANTTPLIDAATGTVHLDDEVIIRPRLTLPDFEQSSATSSPAYNGAKQRQSASGGGSHYFSYPAYDLSRLGLLSCRLGLCLVFLRGRLLRALLQAWPSGTLYGEYPHGDWVVEEVRRKAFHEELLRRELGEPTGITMLPHADEGEPDRFCRYRYEYAWGSISSGWDFKSEATTGIGII